MGPEAGRETSFWKPISGQEPDVPILPTRSATHMVSTTMMCVSYNSRSRGDSYIAHWPGITLARNPLEEGHHLGRRAGPSPFCPPLPHD